MLSDLAVVTPQQIAALGIDIPESLAGATVPLWRSSTNAKFHWADQRCSCRHLPGDRQWQEPSKRPLLPPSDQVSALGFSESVASICMSCARAITISAPTDAFVAVTAELIRGRDWLENGNRYADGSWTWLQFARWRAQQPLVGSVWNARLALIRGKAWAATAFTLRAAVNAYHDQVKSTVREVADSIGDKPGAAALLERAIRMVETESTVMEESAVVLQISGCGRAPDAYSALFTSSRPTYKQAEPWHLVAGMWRRHAKSASTSDRDLAVLAADQLDKQFPHVHDISALPCCGEHEPPVEPGDCVHAWAERVARAHRRTLVRQWVDRLDLAAAGLRDAHRDVSNECTHLICIPWWPLTVDGMNAIAYLSQFDVVCGPVKVGRNEYGGTTQVVVVRAPAWAAAHAAELRSPLRSEPITDEWRQSIEMVRAHGAALVEGEFGTRRKPSRMVHDARAEMDQESDSSYWHAQARPLRPGAAPPRPFDSEGWSQYAVQFALQRAQFVYDYDDNKLLSMGLPPEGNARMQARLEVELQVGCRWTDHDAGAHVCEIDGIVESVEPNGALLFTPDNMYDSVTVPAPYIVGLSFR